MRRAALIFVALIAWGCNGLLGIDEPTIAEPETSTGPGENEDVDAMSTGAAVVCGDGVRDLGEECDDGNEVDGDGCSACEADCGPAPEFRDDLSHHCYLLAGDSEAASWDEAETLCVAWGGHLSAITSADELALIGQRLPASVWIGASRRDAASHFEWVNGDSWDYAEWGDDEPSAAGDCAMLTASHLTFAASDCEESSGYLCERDPTLP